MKRALSWAVLAALAAALVIYLVDLQLDRRSAGGSRRRVRRGDESYLREGRGRVDEVLPTGVYPSSAEDVPSSARAQGMASWGQGERGAAGYEDSGGSEISGQQ